MPLGLTTGRVVSAFLVFIGAIPFAGYLDVALRTSRTVTTMANRLMESLHRQNELALATVLIHGCHLEILNNDSGRVEV